MTLKCRNIKINITLEKAVDFQTLHQKQLRSYEKKTSFTLRPLYLDCVITIYKHSPKSLHITGIKSSSAVTEIFEFLTNVLNMKVSSSKVNNSMFCGKLGQVVDISNIIRQIEQNYSHYTCSFVEEIFPALFIKPNWKQKKSGWPTTILFPNGSFIIMGGTDIGRVRLAYLFITSLVK